MDLDALLAARDGDNPSGDNLEYDPDFTQLQIAATPGEERQAGNQILAAEDPDFTDVVTRALAVLARSHDLRAAVILAYGAVHTKGLPGFAEALAYVRGCLEQHWDSCHPQLDADDDNDPTMRINAVHGLNGAATVLAGLRRAPLTNSRTFGKLTLRDVQMAIGEVPGPEGGSSIDKVTLNAAFVDTGEEALAALLAAIRAIQSDIKAIEAVFSAKTPGFGPDLDDLKKLMQQIARHVADHVAGAPAPEPEDDHGAAPVRRSIGGGSGGIDTAEDARATLDRVIEYFRRAEPSSPVPIILERAKRLVGADFMTIMKDMAPAGVDAVMMIGGIAEDDD